MSKFGLLESEEQDAVPSSLSERLAAFPAAHPKHRIDVAAIDAAAAPHGFVSREPHEAMAVHPHQRRRRACPAEPTRHLAIRLTMSQYAKFVAYADRHQVTYQDALLRLLEEVGTLP